MKILLNGYEDPRMSERIFVGKGDMVFAKESVEEFGFTPGNQYEIQGVDPFGYLVMKNDKGETDEYSTEYFSKTMPLILSRAQ
jgi:hypothetical protein